MIYNDLEIFNKLWTANLKNGFEDFGSFCKFGQTFGIVLKYRVLTQSIFAKYLTQ